MQHLLAVTIDPLVTESIWEASNFPSTVFAHAGAPPPDIPVIFFIVTGFAPFILLAVTLAAGRWLKRREQRVDSGPVRPPGWEHDQ